MAEKLNLTRSGVEFFWKNSDARMFKILQVMENVEHWVVDDVETVSKELVNLGKKMSSTSKQNLTKHSEEVIFIMAYISCGKAFRIMNWLDENHPGCSFHYVMEARQMDDWDPGKLLQDRLRTIRNLNLLGKIFAPSRIRLTSELLKEQD